MESNFMKSRFFSLVLALLITFLTASVSFAADTDKEITNKTIKKEVIEISQEVEKANQDNNFTVKEEKNIINNHSTDAIDAYKAMVLEEAIDKVNETKPELEANEKYKREIIKLDNNQTATLEMFDLTENETLDLNEISSTNIKATTRGASGATGLKKTDHKVVRSSFFKKNGNRYFTAKYTVGYLRGSITLIVENHYSIGSYGLKERYGNVSVRYEAISGGFSIDEKGKKITDSSAKKNGEDINLAGWVTFSLTGLASSGQNTMEFDTRVKLVSKSKTGAKVTEHFYVYENFF